MRNRMVAHQPSRADGYFVDAIDVVRTNRRNYSRRKPAVFSEAAKIGFSLGWCAIVWSRINRPGSGL